MLKENKNFLIGQSSLQSLFTIINGKSKFEIIKKIRIKVIKKGKFIINKNSFLNIPAGFKSNEVEIIVKNGNNEIEYDSKFI